MEQRGTRRPRRRARCSLLPGGGFKKTDPRNVLNYSCPSCGVRRFRRCVNRSGETIKTYHTPRFKKAFERGGPW